MQYLSEVDRLAIADEWFYGDSNEVDGIVRDTVAGSEKAGFISYVDGYSFGSDQLLNMRAVIPEIEPEISARMFGPQSVIWAAANVLEAHKAERQFAKVAELTGIMPRDLRQAIRWNAKEFEEQKGGSLLLQLGLMACVSTVETLDIPQLIQQHPRECISISQERAKNYGLVPVQVTNLQSSGFINHEWPIDNTGVNYHIYLDGPIGVVLTYKQRPIAVASFGALQDKSVGLLQIQGVNGRKVQLSRNASNRLEIQKFSPRGLAPIDWRGMFITLAEYAAETIGAEAVSIPSASKNNWVFKNHIPKHDEKRVLTLAAAEKTYDLPAIQRGYSLMPNGYWKKKVVATP